MQAQEESLSGCPCQIWSKPVLPRSQQQLEKRQGGSGGLEVVLKGCVVSLLSTVVCFSINNLPPGINSLLLSYLQSCVFQEASSWGGHYVWIWFSEHLCMHLLGISRIYFRLSTWSCLFQSIVAVIANFMCRFLWVMVPRYSIRSCLLNVYVRISSDEIYI